MNAITGNVAVFKDYYVNNIAPLFPELISALIILLIGYFVIFLIMSAMKGVFFRLRIDKTVKRFIKRLTRIVLWAILLTIVLAKLGVDIAPIIAGFGIAGFVVGFALKDTLGNLAFGFMLLIYKPFKVGDKVNIMKETGIVEEINIAACVIRTDDNVVITVPNSKVFSQPMKNLTKQKKTEEKKSKKK